MSTTAPDLKTKAVSGKGTVFGIQTSVLGGTVAYTPVAELKSLDFSGSKNELVEVTNFDSASRFREYIATLADAGDCAIMGNYVSGDVGQAAFRGAFLSAAVLSYQITLPLQSGQTTQGEVWVFSGIVAELDNSINHDKQINFSAKVKVTGPVVVTPGS